MSKYELAIWPQDEWRFAIYDNIKKLPRAKDVLKDNPGAAISINLVFFALKNISEAGVKAYDHQADIKIKGKWEYGPVVSRTAFASTRTAMSAMATITRRATSSRPVQTWICWTALQSQRGARIKKD